MPSTEPRVVSHYTLSEKLGSGGMGVVYRAVDNRLGRPVALKFLVDSAAADEDIRKRFMQEARSASSLDHPNICTIFEIDETSDGELFIAMAHYEGETLNAIIRRGPLEVAQALSIAMQIGRGLAAAHEELIIHRDIKPANIMVTARDTVKILDFGLAKLIRQSGLTRPDSSVGTPGYMSPEQIRSESIDHRTDIWSLGVVLFEALTGHLPFKGERTESLIHSILSDEPERVATSRSGIPRSIDRVIQKALAKSPRARYDRMADLLADLQQLQEAMDSGSGLTLQRPAESKKSSVAVLPFVDMSPQKDQEYFCDGIAEELLSALSHTSELHVASRTSAFQFKGTAMDIREIGERLNVSTVLEGSVRKAGDRVRVTAQLVNVSDGYRLWTERYDREMKDIFAIQDEIAQSIARALQVALQPGQSPMEQAKTQDVEAYEFYLKGRQFFHQLRRKGFEVARQMFARAIEIDPNYARAYAGIADCSSFLRLYFGAGEEAVEEADRASLKALELGPDLAEAHVSRGFALSLTKQYDEAEAELRRAIQLNPSLYEAHYIAARVYFAVGKFAEAAEHFERACALTPESYDSWYFFGMCYRALGDEGKVKHTILEAVEAAKKRVSSHPDDSRAWTISAQCLVELGEPDKAAEWIERALAIDPDEPIIQYNAGCVYAALGRRDEALACVEASVNKGLLFKGWIENDPDLNPIRDDPRFKVLMQKLR
ncbi:MAG: protein kinase [Acidobacteriota bacterium]